MKVFDFNIHLCRRDPFESSLGEMRKVLAEYHKEAPQEVCGGNIMVFNSELVFSPEWEGFAEECGQVLEPVTFSLLFDFRKRPEDLLKAALDRGFRSIKFHSLVQKIEEEEFPEVLCWAERAASEGVTLLVDTSIGTPAMYRHDGLRLAAHLIEHLPGARIVLLHSGGVRVMEALLLALDQAGVFLECSFSLPFYRGSRLEEDFAYVYRRLGATRVIYGSDYPFVGVKESLDLFRNFFSEQCGFEKEKQANIFYENALKILEIS